MDIETRRRKQKALMVQAVERRVRSRAQQLYESRGHVEGQELQDWFQAESEVLGDNVVARLYRRMRGASQEASDSASHETAEQASGCETSA